MSLLIADRTGPDQTSPVVKRGPAPAASGLTDVRGTRASDHLDLIRGLSALAVLYSHARVLLLRSAESGAALGLPAKVLYFLSHFGHTAVMVFFVMSGFFISASILREVRTGRWSWKNYLTSRATRLYLVLIPGLLLTALWDHASLAVVADKVPNADTAVAIVDMATVREQSGPLTLLGNLGFLQTIRVTSFGSNVALWSLANEFWYYLIFPCLWLALVGRRSLPARLAYAALGVGLLAFVGKMIAVYFLIWLLGTLLCLLPPVPLLQRRRWGLLASAGALALLLAVLVPIGLGRLHSGVGTDFAVGVAFTLFLFCLLHGRRPGGKDAYAGAARRFAGFSYTLYVTHLPLLIFLRARLTYESAWAPDARHFALVGLIVLGAAGYAYAIARLTEGNTDRVRHWVLARLGGAR